MPRRTHVTCERCGGNHPTSSHPEPAMEAGVESGAVEASGSFETLKEAALPVVEQAVQNDGRDADELIRELDAAKKARDYKAERPLNEALRQRIDLARLRGEALPQEIIEALDRSYSTDAYSDLLQDELNRIIPKEHPTVLVEALMDERFSDSNRLLHDLDDPVREQLYEALKANGAIEKVISLVSATKDVGMKVRLYEDLATWLGPHGGFSHLKRDVGSLMFKKARDRFDQFLERDLVELSGLEDEIKDESDESLQSLLSHTRTIEDAATILKFMRSKESLLAAAHAFDQVDAPEEVRRVVINNAPRLAEAFENTPRILGLGVLQKRTAEMTRFDIPNKFVVVFPNGEDRLTIAWSNTQDYPQHKDLANRTGTFLNEMCSGGVVEVTSLEDGRTRVVFAGRSGDYGPYNQAFLDQHKEEIAERMKQIFQTDVEVVIQPSGI